MWPAKLACSNVLPWDLFLICMAIKKHSCFSLQSVSCVVTYFKIFETVSFLCAVAVHLPSTAFQQIRYVAWHHLALCEND